MLKRLKFDPFSNDFFAVYLIARNDKKCQENGCLSPVFSFACGFPEQSVIGCHEAYGLAQDQIPLIDIFKRNDAEAAFGNPQAKDCEQIEI